MPVIQGFFTDYQLGKWLDQLFAGAPYTPPATLYVGLSIRRASRQGNVNEPSSASGYSRAVAGSGSWGTSSAGGTTNVQAIAFPTPTAAWGTVISMFVADAPTGGNVIAAADLVSPRTINAGDPAKTFAPGAIQISRS